MSTKTSTRRDETVREYRGCNIYPRDRYGMYESYVQTSRRHGRWLRADTLEGIRAVIRDALDNASDLL